MTTSLSAIPIDVIRDHLTHFLTAESCLRLSLTNQSYFHLYQQSDFATTIWELFFQMKWRIVYSTNEEYISCQVKEHPNIWLTRYNHQMKWDADTIALFKMFLEQGQREDIWELLVHNFYYGIDAVYRIWATEKSNENKEILESLLKDMLQTRVLCEIGTLVARESKDINMLHIQKLPVLLAKLVDWKLPLQNYDIFISLEKYVDQELNTLAEILQTTLHQRNPSCRDGCYPILSIIEAMKTIFKSPSETNQNEVGSTSLPEFSFSTKEEASSSPFVGNSINYYAVSNSTIHKVLFFRTGIPITLSIIYAAIVRRATGVHLEPLGIPGHFLLSTVVSDEQTNTEERIFIDAFDGGSTMTLNDVKQMLLVNFEVTWDNRFLTPLTNIEICNRMVLNIMRCQDLKDSIIYLLFKFLSQNSREDS